MTTSDHPIGRPEELAALYAAGAMTDEQARAFESHLDTACEQCAEQLKRLEPAVAELLAGVEPAEAPSRIRDALIEKVGGGPSETAGAAAPNPQVWKEWSSDLGDTDVVIQNATETGWEEIGIEGISVRRLFVDQPRNQMTALIRMAAGTAYPRHIHGGPEECLVLEGRLRVGDRWLKAGDYQRMAGGSEHPVQSTDQGCLLLIISSLTDELQN